MEIANPQQDVLLKHNDLTNLTIRHQLDFDKVEITTDEIPLFDAGFSLKQQAGVSPIVGT